jgi:hypothetical protein
MIVGILMHKGQWMGVSLYVGCIDLQPGMQNNFAEMWGALNHVFVGNCPLLGYYAASSSNFLLMFQDNQSVPSSRVKNPKKIQIQRILYS